MKIKKLFSLAVAMLATVGAWAQTDVTSTYLTNADFSSTDGWEGYVSGSYKDYGNGLIGTYGVRTNEGQGVSTVDDTHLATEYCFGFECRWSGNFASYNQTTSELPIGVYTLTFDVENTNLGTSSKTYQNLFYVKVGETTYTDNSKEWMSGKSSWTTHTISFTLEAAATAVISLGYGTGSNNVGSANTPTLHVSHLKLTYTDLLEGVKALWQNAKAAAEAAKANADYANVTGSELTALNAEIAKAEPTTKEGYEEATSALETATSTFTAAKASYDALVAAKAAATPDLAYADAAKKTALNDAKEATATSAADADTKTAAITTALRAYYESHALAEGVATAVNKTTSIANYDATDGNNGWTWTGNKNNPRNTESWTDSNGKNDYMYFDGGNWNATGWTTTMEQNVAIPAGKYLLTAKGRASDGVVLTMSVGENVVELPHVNASGNVFDRGWGDGSVEFETKGENITILVKATTSGYHQWFSAGDFRLVQLEDHTAIYALANLQLSVAAAQAAIQTESELLKQLYLAATETPQYPFYLYQYFIGGSEAAALQAALLSAQSVDQSDIAAVIAADEALKTATATYLAAASGYERVALTGIVAQRIGLESNADVVALQAQAKQSTATADEVAAAANNVISTVLAPAMTVKVQGKLGFDKDEYAPYNNAELLQIAVASKEMGENPAAYTNEQICAQALAYNTLKPAVQNTEDLDAIYDGSLANAPIQATSENVVLPGWTTKSGNTRQTFKGADNDNGGKACLADAEAQVGLFVHPGVYNYGEQTGYTMPLDGGVVYVVQAKYCAWANGSNNDFTLTILKGSETVATKSFGKVQAACTEAGALKAVKLIFTAPEDADYVLSVNANGNTFMTDFSIKKAAAEDVDIVVTDAEWGTMIIPFNAEVPQGLTVYSADAVDSENNIQMTEQDEIVANTPYIVKGKGTYNFNGVPTNNETSYTAGLLTGVYAATEAPVGTYVLQNLAEKDGVAFYVVEAENQPTVKAGHAFLTVHSSVKAFFLGENADAIEAALAKTAQNGAIYNIAGQRVEKAVKGLYIKNGKKVIVK